MPDDPKKTRIETLCEYGNEPLKGYKEGLSVTLYCGIKTNSGYCPNIFGPCHFDDTGSLVTVIPESSLRARR